MPYCSIEKVRLVSNIESEDVGDADLRDLRDDVATPELNSDVNQKVQKELADRVSDSKTNKVNGSNKTFYLRKPHRSFRTLGDLNDDGEVTTDDVKALRIDGETREELTVASIDDFSEGELTVEKSNGDAVESGDIYFTYAVSPVDAHTPDSRLATACAQLTAAYAFTKIDAPKLKNYSIGDVSINSQTEGYSMMRNKYMESIRSVNNRETIKSGENRQKIRGVF